MKPRRSKSQAARRSEVRARKRIRKAHEEAVARLRASGVALGDIPAELERLELRRKLERELGQK